MPDPGVRDDIVNTPGRPPNKPRPGPVAPTYPTPGNVGDMINGLIGSLIGPGGGGGLGAADKSAALADIALQRKKIAFDQKTGLRDIQQERTQGLKAAINNALQRGIFDSGIRVGNEALVNREANEAVSDLKTQIGFALDALKNREKAIKAGGGGGGGGGGFDIGSALDIISRIMGAGQTYGWFNPTPLPTDRGAPGYGSRTGPGSRY